MALLLRICVFVCTRRELQNLHADRSRRQKLSSVQIIEDWHFLSTVYGHELSYRSAANAIENASSQLE